MPKSEWNTKDSKYKFQIVSSISLLDCKQNAVHTKLQLNITTKVGRFLRNYKPLQDIFMYWIAINILYCSIHQKLSLDFGKILASLSLVISVKITLLMYELWDTIITNTHYKNTDVNIYVYQNITYVFHCYLDVGAFILSASNIRNVDTRMQDTIIFIMLNLCT